MNLIDCLIEDGKDRVRKQEGCAENGGHYKDVDYSPRRGVKPHWKCRCGFMAPKSSRIWVES